MANIQRRPDGRWRARYRDDAGREHARHFDRKTDAQRWLKEAVQADGSERELRNVAVVRDRSKGREDLLTSRRAVARINAGSQQTDPPVALYRHFDAAGVLLYVGITVDVHVRTRTHAKLAEWAPQAAAGTVTWYPSEAAARAAELEAIKSERPLWNLLGAVSD